MEPNKKIFPVLLLASFFAIALVSCAEIIDPNAVIERRRQLEEDLKALESQINSYSAVIQEKQGEITTLQRDIDILEAKINKARLQIKARNIAISQIEDSIAQKSGLIKNLDVKIEDEKDSLGELLRRNNELSDTSLFEIILGYSKMSDFFSDLDMIDSVQAQIQNSFDQIRTTRKLTEEEKQDLENKRLEEIQLRATQEMEKKAIERIEAEKKKILSVTKGQEEAYQALLASRKKDAATIKAQLFFLTGSPSIPFERAVEYATIAYKATGVRPAFLLGVITEESNLGANVGTGNWNIDMAHAKCTKQREAFVQITGELGLDPNLMPVSKKAWYGYCGGAMGPAQFMPTTWLLYKDRISDITGNNPPNPWDPKDAFVASALLLKDNGAAEGTYAAERRAALRYLAGANWSKSAYAFYGDDVMDFAAKYQEQIDIITR